MIGFPVNIGAVQGAPATIWSGVQPRGPGSHRLMGKSPQFEMGKMRFMPPIQLHPSRDLAHLLPLLRDAEEGDARIVAALNDSTVMAYIAQCDGSDVGAAAVRWTSDDGEILYIATRPAARGQGYGKALMRGLIDEARARGVEALNVGTANSNWSGIAFYQKCGFRMASVRKDFFDYLPAPVYDGWHPNARYAHAAFERG